jgi:hypothetical protein
MSFEKPKNLIISDETMAEYEAWLKKIKEGAIDMPDEEVKSLFSMNVCKLLAKDECVNELDCAVCPAAKETFIWARKKMTKDEILYAGELSEPAYSEYPSLGKMNMSEAIRTYHSHIIHLEVADGYFEKKGQQGMVMVHVS